MQSQAELLSHCVALIKQGHYEQAEQLLQLRQSSGSVDEATQILALVKSKLGKNAAANELFGRYLQKFPGNFAVWNNFANHLKPLAAGKAADCYRRAIALKPDYTDALFNFALLNFEAQQYAEALASLEKASQSARQERIHNLIGLVLLAQDRPGEAAQNFQRGLAIKANSGRAMLNYVIALRRQGLIDQALEFLASHDRDVAQNEKLGLEKAALLLEQGKTDASAAQLAATITRHPRFIPAHRTLDKIHFETGAHHKIGVSLRDSYARTQDPRLLTQLAATLEKAGERAQALTTVQLAAAKIPDDAATLRLQGRLLTSAGEPDAAYACFSKAQQLYPAHRDLSLDFCRLLITTAKLPQAEKLLENVLANNKHDQEAWGYLATCWKLRHNDSYQWLCDDALFAQEHSIFDDEIDHAFLAELKQHLLTLHQFKHAPFDQTLRHGTQTFGSLFASTNPLIVKLKQRIQQVLQDYVASLPDDKNHPLLARKTERFKFNGSWSVLLRNQGFHINHTHREGWVSSALYIALPDEMATDYPAGCLQLGQSNLGLPAERDAPERIITPQVGKLALFPSYMWHGTVPFESAQNRLTVAFDVVPTA